mmetsp:Transcript_33566/g.99985  ORF Transcript_33566/g.99985 Transcript_33566/m.99985 type:complete len:322 (-) Transcript_33566:137-1102(-)
MIMDGTSSHGGPWCAARWRRPSSSTLPGRRRALQARAGSARPTAPPTPCGRRRCCASCGGCPTPSRSATGLSLPGLCGCARSTSLARWPRVQRVAKRPPKRPRSSSCMTRGTRVRPPLRENEKPTRRPPRPARMHPRPRMPWQRRRRCRRRQSRSTAGLGHLPQQARAAPLRPCPCSPSGPHPRPPLALGTPPRLAPPPPLPPPPQAPRTSASRPLPRGSGPRARPPPPDPGPSASWAVRGLRRRTAPWHGLGIPGRNAGPLTGRTPSNWSGWSARACRLTRTGGWHGCSTVTNAVCRMTLRCHLARTSSLNSWSATFTSC